MTVMLTRGRLAAEDDRAAVRAPRRVVDPGPRRRALASQARRTPRARLRGALQGTWASPAGPWLLDPPARRRAARPRPANRNPPAAPPRTASARVWLAGSECGAPTPSAARASRRDGSPHRVTGARCRRGCAPARAADQPIGTNGNNFSPASPPRSSSARRSRSRTRTAARAPTTSLGGRRTRAATWTARRCVVERTFTTVGDYRFYCSIHGAPGGVDMAGIVHVVAAPPPPPPPPPPGTPPPPPPPPPGTPPPGTPPPPPPGTPPPPPTPTPDLKAPGLSGRRDREVARGRDGQGDARRAREGHGHRPAQGARPGAARLQGAAEGRVEVPGQGRRSGPDASPSRSSPSTRRATRRRRSSASSCPRR